MKKLFLSFILLATLAMPAMAQVRFHVNVNLGAPPVYVDPPDYPAPVYYPPAYTYPYQGYAPVRWGHHHHHHDEEHRDERDRDNRGNWH